MTRARRSLPIVIALVAASGMGGCPAHPQLPDVSTLSDAEAVARVHIAAARRARMAGVVKARLPGLSGVVMSATLDVALEPPARLSVAVRSFFEQPQQMLVTDGVIVTIYDATQGEPVFLRGPVGPRTIEKVLPIRLSPEEAVEVFLARPAAARRGRLVAVDERAGTYDVWLEAPGAAPCQLTLRAQDDAVLRWRHMKKSGEPLLDVHYGDLRAVGDAVLPYAWTIELVDRSPTESLVFTASDVEFNGAPLPDAAFHLEPPPGHTVRPL